MRHTPGPWKVIDHSWSDVSIYGGGRYIATLSIKYDCGEDTQETFEQRNDADARLIASAPELLSMLEELEWRAGDDDFAFACVYCGCLKVDGHEKDCKLGNLLQRVRGEQ